MTSFNERERAFEAKFAHDENFRFRLMARRDKLFIHWAAEQLPLPVEGRAAFADTASASRGQAWHDTDLLQHVAAAFEAHGIAMTVAELGQKLRGCLGQAEQQLLAEPPKFLGET